MAALDFPASPSDGDTYDNYVYKTNKQAWQSIAFRPAIENLTNVVIADLAVGDRLVYDGTQWTNFPGAP